VTARAAANEHLRDVGAMRLIFLRRPDGLRGAENATALVFGDDHRAFATRETGRGGEPESLGLRASHGAQEVHRRAGLDTVDQHVAEAGKFARADGFESADDGQAHDDNTTR